MSFLIIFSAGCQALEKKPETLHVDDEKVKAFKRNDYEKENYIRVQEYTGEGYTLRDSQKETKEIAIQHQDEVEKAVKEFFLTNYHLEVKINNIVSAKDGVVVYIESVKDPNLNTFAIVPIDLKEKAILGSHVWSIEGEVERAIKSSLYVKAYQGEFEKLDHLLNELVKKHPVTGTPIQAIKNTSRSGYNTSFYSVIPGGATFKELFEKYMNNPTLTSEEIRSFLDENALAPRFLKITIELFMEEEEVQPDEKIIDSIEKEIESMKDIPKGAYEIYLNDNYIDKRRSNGQKENTLYRGEQEQLIKW